MISFNTISRLDERASALFLNKKFLRPVDGHAKIKDYHSPYFSIPTATRVDIFFKRTKKKSIKLSQRSISKIVDWYFQKIEKSSLIQKKEETFLELSDIVPYKQLNVPHLPYPVFQTEKPYRHFYESEQSTKNIEQTNYCPPCLMEEPSRAIDIQLNRSGNLLELSQNVLKNKGVIKRCSSGLFYVHVEKNKDFDLSILEKGILENFTEFSKVRSFMSNLIIPLVLPKEATQATSLDLQKIVGQTIQFKINKLSAVKYDQDVKGKIFVYLELDSDPFTELREKFLLPSKILGHTFHILLCSITDNSSKPKLSFRMNVSCYAA